MENKEKYMMSIIQLQLHLDEDAFELIEIFNRAENNIRHNLTFSTADELTRKRIMDAINESGIANVDKNSARYDELIKLGGTTSPETKGITIIYNEEEKCIPTSLDDIGFYKDVYPLIDGYKEPYKLINSLIEILVEAGYEVERYKEMLELGYLTIELKEVE